MPSLIEFKKWFGLDDQYINSFGGNCSCCGFIPRQFSEVPLGINAIVQSEPAPQIECNTEVYGIDVSQHSISLDDGNFLNVRLCHQTKNNSSISVRDTGLCRVPLLKKSNVFAGNLSTWNMYRRSGYSRYIDRYTIITYSAKDVTDLYGEYVASGYSMWISHNEKYEGPTSSGPSEIQELINTYNLDIVWQADFHNRNHSFEGDYLTVHLMKGKK